MECVVVAGGHPAPDDPLYAYTQGKPKALLILGGRTMLEYVVNGLLAATRIAEVLVVGLGPDATAEMVFTRPVSFLPDQGTMFQNARAGMEWFLARRPEDRLIMFASADIPLLQGDQVDDFIARCHPWDHFAYYPLIRQEQMERQFPQSGRTYVRLQETTFTSGNVVLLDTRLMKNIAARAEIVTNARKHPWKLARLLGFRFLLKFLLRRLTLADIEQKVGQISGYPVKSLFLDHAGLAMDADKPQQVDLLRQRLARQPA